MDSIEEKILRYQCAGGEGMEALFQEIYAYYLPKISGVISSKIWNKQDAEDVQQECQFALWNQMKAGKWNPVNGTFDKYLNGIIHNKITDYYDSHHKQEENEEHGLFDPQKGDTPPDKKKEFGVEDSEPPENKLLEFGVTWNALLKSCELSACNPGEKSVVLRFGLDHRLPDNKNAANEAMSSLKEILTRAYTLTPQERALFARMLVRAASLSRPQLGVASRKSSTINYPLHGNLFTQSQNARRRAAIWQFWANMS